MALVPAAARADATVTVNLNDNGRALAQDLGDNPAEVIQRVTDRVNALYQLENLHGFLTAIGDANAAANRGLGVDYAAQPGEIVFGAVGSAIGAGGPTFGASTIAAGDIYNFGLFAGVSLARWGVPVTVFANGYYETVTIEQLSGHLTTFGIHAQWRALPSVGKGDVRWVGLDVTSGLEYAHDAVGANAPLVQKFTVQGNTAGASRNLTLTSIGTLSLVASTVAIPVIVSTGVRLSGVDVYVGAGVDFTSGSTTLTSGLTGDLSTTSDMVPLGTVAITASDSVKSSPAVLRALAGVQLDVWHIHVYLQGDASQTASSASFGIRVLFQ